MVIECYHNKFHPTEPQCPNLGVWKGLGAGNLADDWTWCDEHAPADPAKRERLPEKEG